MRVICTWADIQHMRRVWWRARALTDVAGQTTSNTGTESMIRQAAMRAGWRVKARRVAVKGIRRQMMQQRNAPKIDQVVGV